MIDHETTVFKILSQRTNSGKLNSREGNTVEFKRAFNLGNAATYAKTMAAFANNSGGYIIFGIEDSPRKIIGLSSDNFENLSQEKLTDIINSYFAPAVNWDIGMLSISLDVNDDNRVLISQMKK